MAALRPKLAFRVENTLSGEGELPVEIEFESMEDFTPAKVASKVDALRKLMEARNQLSALLTYMDGKSGAEELIAKVMRNPDLLKSIAQVPNSDSPAA
jgi:type VI secretion system protein ImpB